MTSVRVVTTVVAMMKLRTVKLHMASISAELQGMASLNKIVILGAFAKLLKTNISFVVSIGTRGTRLLLDGFS